MTNKKIGIIIATAFLLIALILGVVFMLDYTNRQNVANQKQTNVFEVKRGETTTTVEEDEKAAVNVVSTLLNYTNTGAKNEEEMLGTLEALSKGDYSSIDPKAETLLHFGVQTTEDDKIRAYQSLTTLSNLVTQHMDKISADYTNYEPATVVVDPETGIVYVSLSAFMNSPTYFTFTVINIDGVWKVDPHTLVESVKLLEVTTQGGETNPTGEIIASPEPTEQPS